VALLCAAAAPRARAGDEAVPPKLALSLMVKVLMYDRNFVPRGAGEFVLALVHEPGQKAELAAALDGVEEVRAMQFKGRPLKFVTVELRTPGSFRQAVARANASALVLVAGLSPGAVEAVVQAANEDKLYTLALDPRLVERWAAISIANENGRPRILLNRDALVRMNAAFELALLKIAKIYR
jgi:hypothetical protein